MLGRIGLFAERARILGRQIELGTRRIPLGLRLARLGAGPIAAAEIFAATVVHAVVWGRVTRLSRRLSRLCLRVGGRKLVWAIGDFSDLLVLEEVIIGGAYDTPLAADPHVIFDLGSGNGTSILYFRLRYPDAAVYGFEPDPVAFANLERNTRQLDGVSVRNVAIAGSDGPRQLYRSEEGWSSSLVEAAPHREAVEVTGKSLDSLVAELGVERIDLMKIDIEGAEFEALRRFRSVDRVEAMVGELHFDIAGADDAELPAALRDFRVDLEEIRPGRYTFRAFQRAV